jgi:T4 RnlA family RNA ligase
MNMQTQYGRDLYNDLTRLVSEPESPFYSVDHVKDNAFLRVFTYRLASYSDFIKPSALESRGHMFEVTESGDYIRLAALPPAKFFNRNENPLVMNVDFSKTSMIMDKMDGSIMTTYLIGPNLYLKSKTSVSSPQANAANEYLNKPENSALYNYLLFMIHAGYSVSLEWTSPRYPFRIVLPYANDKLTVLCARDLMNGQHVSHDFLYAEMEEYGCVEHLVEDHLTGIEDSRKMEFIDNIRHMRDIEGYVIFADGMYTKHKTDWYCALHHTKDSVASPRRLFEAVAREAHDDLRGMFFDDADTLRRIDEMEAKVQGIYRELEKNVDGFVKENGHLDRKDFAIKGTAELPRLYFALAMNMYLGKSNDYQEWLVKHYKDFGFTDEAEELVTEVTE